MREKVLFPALTDQGRHKIRQASGVTTLEDINRQPED